MNRRKADSLSLLLFVLVTAAFLPCAHNGFVNLDDNIYIYENTRVRQGLTWHSIAWAFTNLEAGFWHPLTWLSILFDSSAFGMWPGGHHLTSVLLHALSTVVLFRLLHRMTGGLWRSAAVASFFGIHPLHVEPVAWAASRKDVLSALFFLLTLLAYTRYAQAGSAKGGKSKTRNPKSERSPNSETRVQESGVTNQEPGDGAKAHPSRSCFYVLALVFFLCGLMSKAMVVTAPVILILMDWWPLRRFQFSGSKDRPALIRRLFLEKVPFLAAAFAAALVTTQTVQVVGALRTFSEFPLSYRVCNAGVSYVAYLAQMVWPAGLAVFYPCAPTLATWTVAGAFLILLAATGLAGWTARKKPYLAFGWAWYLVTLLPMSGLVQVGAHARADRYTYVPLIGVFILLAWGAHDLTLRWRFPRTWLAATASLMVLSCLVLTREQLGHWKNTVTLMSHATAVTRNNALAQNLLGVALAMEGRPDAGIPHLEEAVRLAPASWDARNNLGTALARQGRLDEALPQLEAAVKLEPGALEGRRGLADLLMAKRRLDEALAQYKEVLKIAPRDAIAHHNLGMILAMRGQLDDAIARFQEAVKITPGDADAHCHLGIALGRQGHLDDAIRHLEEALRLNPSHAEAHCNLGGALSAKQRWPEAIAHFQQALKLRPDYPEAERNLRAAKELEAAATNTARPPNAP